MLQISPDKSTSQRLISPIPSSKKEKDANTPTSTSGGGGVVRFAGNLAKSIEDEQDQVNKGTFL